MGLLRNFTKKEKRLATILFFLLVSAILFLVISKNNQNSLAVYMKDNTVNVWDKEDSGNLDISLKEYKSSTLNLAFSIPDDWTERKHDTGVSFTHEPSASVFSVEITDYDPAVNNLNASSISATLVEQDYIFVNYIRLSSTSCQILYQDKSKVANDYIRTVFWDREHIVTLSCSFSDANYQGIIPYFDKIISSFKWNYEKPVNEGYAIFFHPGLDIEFMVPETWVCETSDTAIRFADSTTGAMILLTINTTADYLDSLTSTDMANMIKTGRSSFMMKNFNTSKTKAYAYCTYSENNKQVCCDQYIFADGKRHYFISVNYYAGTLDSSVGEVVAGSFRKFD